MTSNSTIELRAALRLLAEQAPSVDSLDHTAWAVGPSGEGEPRRGGGRRRVQLLTLVTSVAVVAALIVGVQLIRSTRGPTPATSARAILEVRPLVAPAVTVITSGELSTDPLQALTFPIPSSEADYDRLSATDKQHLLAALATTHCDHQSASTAKTRVACSAEISGYRLAFLLGPSLFGNDQIKSAHAVAPSAGVGQTQWTLALTLRGPGRIALARYTTAHHSSGIATTAGPSQCGDTATPCGDYLGFLANGSVLSIPATIMPITSGAIRIAGNFDKQSATTLAHRLRP